MEHFLLYATANDKKGYFEDIRNFYDLCRFKTGVGKVYMYVAISEVNELSVSDDRFVAKVKKAFENHEEIELKEVFFKSNIGRDFSSYNELFKRVEQEANVSRAYLFFRNRSARGPFESGWYARFVDQLNKFPNIALCGNTINMYHHPDIKLAIEPHVQSYAFIITLAIIRGLGEFPGLQETTRFGAIGNGEVALSQQLIGDGAKLTSLAESSLSIGNDLTEEIKAHSNLNTDYQLPKGLPFYHYQDLKLWSKLTRLAQKPFVWNWFSKFE